jgi:DNA-binding transcriptional regulator YhcF (GntR family)
MRDEEITFLREDLNKLIDEIYRFRQRYARLYSELKNDVFVGDDAEKGYYKLTNAYLELMRVSMHLQNVQTTLKARTVVEYQIEKLKNWIREKICER